MIFAPLHIYSGYSFLESGLTIEKIVQSVSKNNYFGASLTDKNVLFSLPRFVKAMEKIKKSFIVGLEIEFEENIICLYATDEKGYQNLCIISSEINKNSSLLTKDMLKEHNEGILAIIDTNKGKFKENFLSIELSESDLAKYVNEIAKLFKETYLGIEIKERNELNHANKVRKFAAKYTYECVAFPHIKYQKEDDAISLMIVEAIKNDTTIQEKNLKGRECFYDEEFYKKIYLPKELANTVNIVKKSTFVFSQKRGEMLHYDVPNSSLYLKDICLERLKELGLDKDQRYIDRLENELSVITQMGYSDYFLIVRDYFMWAKKQDILVSVRGSSAGSLVIYLLEMTSLDPIEYGLHFERFLNVSRKTLPDIDVDFMDIRRSEVIDYCRNKYGKDRVANIITFQTILAKQSLRDIGRIYQYPSQHISLLSKRLTDKKLSLRGSYKKLPAFKELIDSDKYFLEMVSLASKIEGLARQSSLHAAGIILNKEPIEGLMPVITDLEDNLITQYEMGYLEEQGFLKMDLLGLNYLSITSNCVDLINKNHKDVHLNKFNLPYTDEDAIKVINQGLTMGIFQLESSGMKNAIKTLNPTSFDDVAALLALFRPGPMAFIKNYARRKDGKEKIPYAREQVSRILKPTYGIITYQEQITELAVSMAGMSMVEADNFRNAVSKKKAQLLASLKESFIQGAIKNGFTSKEANDYYEQIDRFANYGFNKSHSYTYAQLTCRMAYLKAHYPLEFYSTILESSAISKDPKFSDYLSEIKKLNIKILPPDINKSGLDFEIVDNTLLFPLTSIKDVNHLIANKILEVRKDGPFSDFFDFIVRISQLGLSQDVINHIIDSGALDSFGYNRKSLKASITPAMQYAEVTSSFSNQSSLGIVFEKPLMIELSEDENERLEKEYEAIGIMLSKNPLSLVRESLSEKGIITINDLLNEERNTNFKVAGILASKKTINTKKGLPMAFIKIFDETSEIEGVLFPEVYKDYLSLLETNEIIILDGYISEKDEEQTFVINKVERM